MNNLKVTSEKVVKLVLVGMFLLVGAFSFVSADYRFEDTNGVELVHIYSDNGNLSATGNISTDSYFVGSGRYLTDLDVSELDLSDYYLKSVANSTFIFRSEENNLNVNSSTYWADLSGYVSRWFRNTGGQLDFNEELMNSTIDLKIAEEQSSLEVNSSDYWDNLDSPADIKGSQIDDDLDWVELSELVSLVGNWSQDKGDYYLKSQVYNKSETYNRTEVEDLIGSGDVDTLDGYDASYFMPLNKSVYGDFDFNDGWTDGGVSIIGGNIYAQSGYFYDINSLQVTNLAVNGSLIPESGFDNQFDIGSSTLRWNDGYFGGVVNASSFVGDGSGLTGISGSQIDNDLNWLNESQISGAETDPYWTGNFTNGFSDNLNLNGNYLSGDGDNEGVFVDGDGNVGIGTSSPGSKLHVSGNITSIGTIESAQPTINNNFFVGRTSATEVFTIKDTGIAINFDSPFRTKFTFTGGNVGIGTDNPYGNLEISGTNPTLFLSDASAPLDKKYRYIQSNDHKLFFSRINDAQNTYIIDMTLSDTGNLGIGTTTPQESLHINGSAIINGTLNMDSGQINNLANGTASQDAVTYSQLQEVNSQLSGNVSDTYVPYTGATQDVDLGENNFSVGTSDLFVDASNGNVGIGTSSPGFKLHIREAAGSGGITPALILDPFSATNGDGSSIDFITSSDGISVGARIAGMREAGGADGALLFYTRPDGIADVTEKMRIDSEGNVGIGTTTPQESLHVNGNAIINGTLNMDSGQINNLANGTASQDAVTYSQLQEVNSQLSGNVSDTYVPYIGATQDVDLGSNNLSVGGNVGIGTTSPDEKLDVVGSVQIRGNQADEADGLILYNTASPVTSEATTAINIKAGLDNGAGGFIEAGRIKFGEEGDWQGTSTRDSYISLSTRLDNVLGEKVRITSTGNVGIGTTNPNYKLTISNGIAPSISANADNLFTVRGTGSSTGYWRGRMVAGGDNVAFLMGEYNSMAWLGAHNSALNSWEDFYINPDGEKNLYLGGTGSAFSPIPIITVSNSLGSVGIGTITPQESLHVNGSAIINGTLNMDSGQINNLANGTASQDAVTYSQLQEVNSQLSSNVSDTYVPYTGSNKAVALSDYDFSVGGNNLFVNSANGRVGLGTDNPGQKLHVEGTLRLQGGAQAWDVGTSVGDDYTISASGVGDFFTILNTNGNVGIGTTSPLRLLSLYSNNTETVPRFLVEQDGTGDAVMAFSLTGGQGWSMGIDNSAGDKFMIHNTANGVDTSSQFVIEDGGNVGIGISSPELGKLQVSGNGYFSVSDSSTALNLVDTNGGTANYRFIPNYVNLDLTLDAISSSNHQFIIDNSGAGTMDLIVRQGNVGIGTDSPNYLFEVENNSDTLYMDPTDGIIGVTGRTDIKLYANGQNIFRGLDGWTGTWSDSVTTSYFQTGRNGGNTAFSTLNGAPYNRLAFTVKDNSGSGVLFTDSGGGNTVPNGYFEVRQNSGTRTDLLVDYDGNVGIGTTTPQESLHVNGSAIINGTLNMDSGQINNLANGTASQDAVTYSQLQEVNSQLSSNVSDTYVPYTGATQDVDLGENNFSVGTSDLFVDASSGNVGIGTSSPEEKLDVMGNGIFGNRITSRNSYSGTVKLMNDGATQTDLFLYQAGIGSGHIGFKPSDSKLYIVNSYATGSIDDTTSIVLDSSGNVGIGTASPNVNLEVEETHDVVWDENIPWNSPTIRLANPSITNGNGVTLDFTMRNSGTAHAGISGITPSSNNAELAFFTEDSNVVSERMRIDSLGNVGIGTTSPNRKLEIKSGGSGTNVFGIESSDDSFEPFRIYESSIGGEVYLQDSSGNTNVKISSGSSSYFNGGNVGIGIDSPEGEFHLVAGGGGQNPDLIFEDNAGIKYDIGVSRLNEAFVISSGTSLNSNQIASFKSTGNVGIGTISPSTKLDVNGTITANAFVGDGSGLTGISAGRWNVSGTNFYPEDLNYNVGIGTATPQYNLHINGDTSSVAEFSTTSTGQTTSDGLVVGVDGSDRGFVYNRENTALYFGTNGASRMYIDADGEIGIGTETPGAKLDIEGDVRADSYDAQPSQDLVLNSSSGTGNVVVVIG